jgi:hypothetical protein
LFELSGSFSDLSLYISPPRTGGEQSNSTNISSVFAGLLRIFFFPPAFLNIEFLVLLLLDVVALPHTNLSFTVRRQWLTRQRKKKEGRRGESRFSLPLFHRLSEPPTFFSCFIV